MSLAPSITPSIQQSDLCFRDDFLGSSSDPIYGTVVTPDEWLRDDYVTGAWNTIFTPIPKNLIFLSYQNNATSRIDNLLHEVMRQDLAERWMSCPNPGLDGRTPLELMEDDQQDRVEALLLALAEGITT